MVNDITNINSNRAQLSNNQTASVKNRNEAKSDINTDEGIKNQGDRVSLTNTAARLRDIEQQLSNTSPVDQKRVQAVQAAISKGEYSVDAERVADKMLAFENSIHK